MVQRGDHYVEGFSGECLCLYHSSSWVTAVHACRESGPMCQGLYLVDFFLLNFGIGASICGRPCRMDNRYEYMEV